MQEQLGLQGKVSSVGCDSARKKWNQEQTKQLLIDDYFNLSEQKQKNKTRKLKKTKRKKLTRMMVSVLCGGCDDQDKNN